MLSWMGCWMLLAACGHTESTPVLVVLAASSLTEATTELASAYEAVHGFDVQVSHAGSQVLATQIRHGIRADVFASADAAHLAELTAEGLAGPGRPFASNALVLAVSPSVQPMLTLETLPAVRSLVVGEDEVPLGAYTRVLLEASAARYGADWRQAVEARIVSREPNARLVAGKVAWGEADAAIVYATDLVIDPDLRVLPLELAPTATYTHAVLQDSRSPQAAEAWLAFVESPTGQAVLARHGFGGLPVSP